MGQHRPGVVVLHYHIREQPDVLPTRSPKLNGHVERAQRTHTEEFYQLYNGDLTMGPLNQALRQ